MPSGNAQQQGGQVQPGHCRMYMLWIDGVGAWQLCLGDSFIIGAPSFDSQSPDIALLANISRQHATLTREGETWSLHAHHATSVSGNDIATPTLLTTGDEIRLGGRVRLGFRVPSVLSTSAVIDFESEHRPTHSVDGIILLSDHCLLGPRKDHHICCSDWSDMVVLFHRDGQLHCRSQSSLTIDGNPIEESALLKHGSLVAGEELRFRVEQME